MIRRRDTAILAAMHPGLSGTSTQIADEIYVRLRDGLINPLNDTFDFAIPLTTHLDHQHGEDHGWQSHRPHHQQQTQP